MKIIAFDDIKILVLGGSQAAKILQKSSKIFKKLKNSEIPIKVYQQCQNEQKDN